MKKIKFIVVGCLAVLVLSGCDMSAWPDFSALLNDEQANINDEVADDTDLTVEEELLDYTLVLGRTDPDIQSQKTYTFSLPQDVSFEVMGVDAPSTLIEFKSQGEVIFSWTNRDYAVNEDTFAQMYPDDAWYDYSFTGDHTNVVFLDNEDYEDDLLNFMDSLFVDEELVF